MGVTAYGCAPVEADLVRAVAARLGVRASITDAPVSPDTVALAVGNRCISVDHRTPVTGSVLAALHAAGVRFVSTRSVGVDHVDRRAAARLGISVANVAYSPDSVADHTLMLILMGLRRASSLLRRVEVHDYRSGDRPGRELRDLTVGVVGTGRIGTAVIDRLRGFGCRIATCDSRRDAPVDRPSLTSLLRRSDVVTLHVPLTVGTRHLLDRPGIAQMKPGAVLVNTARGGLVDTEALVEALEGGRLGGAALDVVEGEEGVFSQDRRTTPVEHPLLLRLHRLPDVIITPHTAYYTDHALGDAVAGSLLGCLRFEDEQRHG
ncbi:lactate dehydrogenase [Iamia sp. SCSIO 61187]|uniref:NAD(P)-dependent oxidoreductase n=1 Tax=Iamia sp. SCSIO 61187 TaxID=2722752 RepID=UPI001C634C80|nr:NAD(P)-dependent oxidoreductase [Iamia sp. SCSIO 61187]QYG95434.1 lactate dehydrogenase [Iamia sp. SCSIO 61187]